MASLISATTTMLSDGYNFYLWTLSIAGEFLCRCFFNACVGRKCAQMPKCQNDVPADKRTRGWLMVDSPLPTIGYTILYLIMVALGPRLMKNRRPFTLKKTMIAYNLSMCVLNAYIAFEVSFESKPKEHTPHSNSQELSKKKIF